MQVKASYSPSLNAINSCYTFLWDLWGSAPRKYRCTDYHPLSADVSIGFYNPSTKHTKNFHIIHYPSRTQELLGKAIQNHTRRRYIKRISKKMKKWGKAAKNKTHLLYPSPLTISRIISLRLYHAFRVVLPVPTTVSTISSPLKLGYRFAKLRSQSSAAPAPPGELPIAGSRKSAPPPRAGVTGLLGAAVLPPVLSLVGFGGGGGLAMPALCVMTGTWGVGALLDPTCLRTALGGAPGATGLLRGSNPWVASAAAVCGR